MFKNLIQKAKDKFLSWLAGIPVSTDKKPAISFEVQDKEKQIFAPKQKKVAKDLVAAGTPYEQAFAFAKQGVQKAGSADPLGSAFNFLTRDVFVRAPFRAAQSLGETFAAPLKQRAGYTKPFEARSAGEAALFGTDPIERFGKSAERQGKYALPSLALAGLSLGADVTPFGGFNKNIFKQIAKETAVEKIIPLVKKSLKGIGESEAAQIAKELTTVSTKEGVEQFFSALTKKGEGFQGFTDLSTKLLEKLKGKSITSKQEILDFTNAGDLKQPERDLFRKMLADEGDKVNVPEFANKVKSELLPLEVKGTGGMYQKPGDAFSDSPKYENITLPDELRGAVAQYDEHIYNSPIKTSAGDVHGFKTDNYFAHTRIEDLPTDTRRVIELQSDLFQKGRLEQEGKMTPLNVKQADAPAYQSKRDADLAKLEPYRNTWHERVIREEVKKAAEDGKKVLQFPTGETAMKIEGLGGGEVRWTFDNQGPATPGELKVGKEIWESEPGIGMTNEDAPWIITDVLGDGKFKAMPKDSFEQIAEATGEYTYPDDALEALRKNEFNLNDLTTEIETFDISGKLDTENPIYKFYEKEVGKYLKNKYGAEIVTDPQGVKWWQINIDKTLAHKPVEAFGVAAGIEQDENGKVSFDPKKAALGVLALGLTKKFSPEAFEQGVKAAEKTFNEDQKIIRALNEQRVINKTPSFWQQLKKNFNPFKYEDETIKNLWRKRVAGNTLANEKANEEFLKLAEIPEKEGLGTILQYQAGEKTPYSEKIKAVFDSLYNEANARGLDTKYLENYIPQVYANQKDEVLTAVAKFMDDNGVPPEVIADYFQGKPLPVEYANPLKLSPSFTKERAFPDYKTAMEYGLTPKYSNPAQLAAHYRNEMEKTLANREWLASMKEEGVIHAYKYPGDMAVDLPFSDEQLYTKPSTAKALENYFRDEENLGIGARIARFGAGASRTLQEIVLSGGVPGTNANFFTIGQGIKDLTAAETKVLGNLARSNLDSTTIAYFRANQGYIKDMAEEGIDLSGRTGNWDKVYDKLSAKTGFAKFFEKSGQVFDTAFNKKTFKNFMPMQVVSTYKNSFEKAIEQGLTKEEARTLAANTTKAWAGLAEDWGRGKTTQDVINSLFFAPKFREGLINLFGNTAKSVTTEIGNPAFAKNRKFIAGIALTYAMYNALNKKLTGNYMWENEPGKEFDLKIPRGDGKFMYLAFLPSVMAFPRNMLSGGIALTKGDFELAGQKLGTVFSMPIKLVSEIASNKDYFGRPIWNEDDTREQKLQAIAAHLWLNYNHPYVSALYNKFAAPEDKKKDWAEVISKMAETPFKFNTQENIDRAKYFNALDARQEDRRQQLEPIKELYARMQALKAAGQIAEGDELYEQLTPEEKKLYQDVKTSEKTKATNAMKQKLYPVYLQLKKLKEEGRIDEGNAIYNALSAEEKRVYQLVKKQFDE